MIKKLLIISLLCLATAQTTQTLSLDDFLKTSLQNHPLIEKSKADYISQLRKIESVEGIKDWNLFMSSSYTKGYSGLIGFSKETEILQITGGAGALLLDTGTRLQLSSEASIINNMPNLSGGNDNIYSFNVNLNISQPILQNAFGIIDEYPIKLAKYNQELIELKYLQDLEDFQKTLINDYLEWQLSYKKMLITKEQFLKAENQLKIISEQYNKGASEKIDLVQTKQNLKAKYLQHLSAKQEYQTKQLTIISRLNTNKTNSLNEVIPENISLSLEKSETESINYLKKESNLSKILKLNKNIQEETILYKDVLTKPAGELFLAKTIGSSENDSSKTLSEFGTESPFTIGIKFESALNNTFALKEADSEKYKLKMITKQNEDILKIGVDAISTIYKNINFLDLMIKENEELIQLSKESTELEEKRFKQGRSSLFFLLSSQDQYLGTLLQMEILKTTKMQLINQLNSQLDTYQKKSFIQKIIQTSSERTESRNENN